MKKIRETKTGREVTIEAGFLYIEGARQCAVDADVFGEIIGDGYTNAIRVLSLDVQWVENTWIDYGVRLETDVNMQMTLRREIRSGSGYWYAYRRAHGVLHKRYVGSDNAVTQKRLLDVARRLPSA